MIRFIKLILPLLLLTLFTVPQLVHAQESEMTKEEKKQ